MKRTMFVLIAAAVLALPVLAQANEEKPVKVQDFAVFVDPPTGFVFVKMPAGWKFIGKVEPDTVASLPASVITSLLPAGERESMDVAKRTPVKQPGNG